MANKQRKTEETPAAEQPAGQGFRRTLLGVLTALIVSRPLVLGEDPGILNPLSDSTVLLLPLFWLLALLTWSIGRYSRGETGWQGGIVETALLLAGLAVAASSYVAPYKHPAQLVTWEWLVLFAALFLLRQVVVGESDRRHILAAFLATAVALSCYAAYQYHIDLPRIQARLATGEEATAASLSEPRPALAAATGGPVATLLTFRAIEQQGTLEEHLALRQRRELAKHATATYAHPTSFAAYLLLFLPALGCAVYLRSRQGSKFTGLTVLSAVSVLGALWLTHSSWAFIGLGLACLIGLLIAARRRAIEARLALTVGASFVFFLAILLAVLDQAWPAMSDPGYRHPGARAPAVRMIQQHPLLGVGAGNYERSSGAFAQASETPTVEPHNFLLELWATSGIVAALAVLAALGGFFWLVLRSAPPAPPAEGEAVPSAPEKPRWEFYLGGMVGLFLAYILRQISPSPDEVLGGPASKDDQLIEALLAIGRGVIWFGAFALFEGLRWPGRWMAGALATGVGATLVLLCFAGGINWPSVALPLWLVMGLALCALELPLRQSKSPLARVLPVVLALGFFAAFYVQPFDPVLKASAHARSAAEAVRAFDDAKVVDSLKLRDPQKYLLDRVIDPLEKAVKEDPGNARWQHHLATQYGRLWALAVRRGDLPAVNRFALRALEAAREAQRLDPAGPEGYLDQLNLHLMFASEKRGTERQNEQMEAIRALARWLEKDSANPLLHYRLALRLQEVGRTEQAREAAQNAITRDDKAPAGSSRKLSPWKRLRVEQWAEQPIETAPKR